MKESWEIKKIGKIAKTGAGGTPLKASKEYYDGGNVPWLLSGEISQGEIFESKKFITQKGLENSSAKLFPIDTVLVAMYGATAGQVGILRCVASTNQAVCGVLPNENLIPEYVFYFFLMQKENLISQAVGNAQPNISQAKIKNIKIPIPPLPEQKTIVAILDKAFAAIDNAKANIEKNIANVKELFQSKLNEIFSQKGDGWEEKKLADLIDVKHGFAFKSKFFDFKGNYVLLTPGNYYESGGYKDRGDKQKYYIGEIPEGFILEKDDLLVAMTEQAPGLLGSPLIVPESNKFLHNQRLGLVTTKDGINIDNHFLYFFFNTSYLRDEVFKSGTGVKVRHTSPTKIRDVKCIINFSSQEQKKVNQLLECVYLKKESLVRHYSSKILSLKELKKSFLQKAFAGELTAHQIAQSNVVQFPVKIPRITPTELHCGVIALAYEKHEEAGNLLTFHRVKSEKIVHLVESHVGIDLERKPVKDAAGPNDSARVKSKVEHRAKMANYFHVVKKDHFYEYSKGNQFNKIINKTKNVLSQQQINEIDSLLDIMVKMDTSQAEIVATVFAAWNNLILRKEVVTDQSIVREARENWHPDKLKIPEERFYAAIDWMKRSDINLIPKGRGKLVE